MSSNCLLFRLGNRALGALLDCFHQHRHYTHPVPVLISACSCKAFVPFRTADASNLKKLFNCDLDKDTDCCEERRG